MVRQPTAAELSSRLSMRVRLESGASYDTENMKIIRAGVTMGSGE